MGLEEDLVIVGVVKDEVATDDAVAEMLDDRRLGPSPLPSSLCLSARTMLTVIFFVISFKDTVIVFSFKAIKYFLFIFNVNLFLINFNC